MSFCVAIDGPAAAGKGTIARQVAKHFGYAHLDTGLLYRAVGYAVLEGQAPLTAAQNLTSGALANPELRTAEVAQEASKVAAIPEVRAALVEFQRSFARQPGGAVLDGRDIGTVICPEAEAKLFVTARPDVRARRRFEELSDKDGQTTFDAVLADVKARDDRDTNRSEAPLKAAADALTIDTSDLSISAAVAAAIKAVSDRQSK